MAKCERCDRRVGSDYWMCRGCERLLEYSERHDWVVDLGLSIRRFVRDSEVDRLKEIATSAISAVRRAEDREAFQSALEQLVWHAKEGTR